MAQQSNRRTFLVGASAAAAAAALPLGTAGPASAAPRRRSAATVLHSGIVFTGRPGCHPAQAVAVGRDGTILAVGSNGEVRRFLGRDTEAIDLKGGFVMPGLVDGHAHPISAGLSLHNVSLGDAEMTIAQIQKVITAALKASADKEPDGWLQISMWNSSGVLPAGTVVTKAGLDVLDTKRPILVRSSDGHNAWVNSRALALAGITKATADPEGGSIVRDASGEPTGLLKDTATALVRDIIPDPTLAEEVAAAAEAFAMLAGAGVTSLMDAGAGDSGDIYLALAASDKLKLRTRLSYRLSATEAKDTATALATLRAFEKKFAGADLLSAGTAKVFMDGVMEYPAHTAAMLDPYLVNNGTDSKPDWEPGTDYGSLYFDQDTITNLAVALDRAGWQMHAHAIGDRAVRTAIIAYEAAVRHSGRPRDNRHTLAHVELIAPSDIRRAARARILACLQLQWAEYDSYTTDSLLPYLGTERQSRIYPARSMERAGIRLTGGTDWPIDDFNPWRPVDQAITRTGPDGTPAFHPEEGLSRLSSLRMHTYGSSYQLHQEHLTGTLEVGKQADLVLTDRDLLKIKATEISGTQAELTMIGGEIVHDSTSTTAVTRKTHASTAAAKTLRAMGVECRSSHSHLACGH
ncbi:amidohydrolase [Streptomyces sp. NPDC048282]|uniref:amidohydrolase n=1 Tax=Streptomyces sp. NPDC048282 TaxID=3365528 RepID=UPI003714B961